MLVLKNTIKECRGEKHINQQQMADDLGVTRETLGNIQIRHSGRTSANDARPFAVRFYPTTFPKIWKPLSSLTGIGS